MKRKFLSILALAAGLMAHATSVSLTLNTTSRSCLFVNTTTGDTIALGENQGTATKPVFNFTADAGEYLLTAYGTDGTTVNGKILVDIDDVTSQAITISTGSVRATNNSNKWVYGTDYTAVVRVMTREGKLLSDYVGEDVSATGLHHWLCINGLGLSYQAEFIPSAARKDEGYQSATMTATINAATTIQTFIPLGAHFKMIVPANATAFVGLKTSHYVTFTEIPYESKEVRGDKAIYHYTLGATNNSTTYNYRVSAPGKLTHAGVFYFRVNNTTGTVYYDSLEITSDMMARDPKWIDRDMSTNKFNVADVFLNINERGHLKLTQPGDSFDILPFRNWQLVNTATDNYMIEPDYHFTVLNLNGQADNSVVTVKDEMLRAVGKGTAIVLVTYDAISVRRHANTPDGLAYVGAEYWGAIWPENTGVFVVTVGEDADLVPHMTANEVLNAETARNAGINVDAEHDVFYYLDTASIGGCLYTFKPEKVTAVELAYPTIGSQSVSYNGFSTNGVTLNADGSYTILLREGNNIVRLTDQSGNHAYQVMRAKPCHREITLVGREFTGLYLPGDQVKVQYSGLYHPANKLGGIYNMSAFLQYNNTPNGTAIVGTANQYNFAATPSAQAFTLKIPDEFNTDETQVYSVTDGVLKISGFGDPIGNHRLTTRTTGRNPNFTAVQQAAVFGKLPDFHLPLMQMPHKYVKFISNQADPTVSMTDYKEYTLTADSTLVIDATIFNYTYKAKKKGFTTIKGELSITAESPDTTYITLNFQPLGENAWDGSTLKQPVLVTEEESNTVGGQFEGLKGYYKITSGYEMAWFANAVNGGQRTISGCLANDIDLADEPWTRIGTGTGTTAAFQGKFDGLGHTIDGLYIEAITTYQGLFGGTRNATIKNLTVKGEHINNSTTNTGNYQAGLCAYGYNTVIDNCTTYVDVTGRQYVGGICAYGTLMISNCVNYGTIKGSSSNIGGIAGQLQCCGSSMERCANFGDISTTAYGAAGLVGYFPVGGDGVFARDCFNQGTITGQYNLGGLGQTADQTYNNFFNCYNVGEINASNGDRFGSIHSSKMRQAVNSYAIKPSVNDININYMTEEQFASGEVAWKLGKGFTQKIGVDKYPTFGSDSVYRVLVRFEGNPDGDNERLVVDSLGYYFNLGNNCTLNQPTLEGYHFISWGDETTAAMSFSVLGDTVVTARMEVNRYDIVAFSSNEQMGTVSGSGNYRHGERVTLRATAAEHYHFVRWSNDSTAAKCVFSATEADTITAIFAIDQHSVNVGVNNVAYGTVTGAGTYDYNTEITLTATPAEGYHFLRWGDGVATATRTLTVTDDMAFTANFGVNQYSLRVTSADEAKGQVSGSGTYAHGTEAEVTAIPAKGYHLSGWSNGSRENPMTVVMKADSNLTATFALNDYVVTLTSEDAAAGSVSGSGDYAYDEEATLTATPAEGYHFLGWSDGVTDAVRKVRVKSNLTLSAAFAINVYKVEATVATDGTGYVTGSGNYRHGSTLTLEAIPANGYHFTSWSDDNTQNPRNITANADLSLTARFELNEYTLTLDAGEGGTVSGAGKFKHGEQANVSATASTGYHFTGWSDGVTEPTRTLTVNSDLTLIARFEVNRYTVSVSAATEGTGIVNGSGSYTYNTTATLSALAAYGYHFTAWSDGDTQNPRTLTVTDDVTLTAQFALNEYTLTLTANDSEKGTVTGAGTFKHGEQATISATPASGSRFLGWSDGVSEQTRTITLYGDMSLTANFGANSYTVTATPSDNTMGFVSGAGTYAYGLTATLTATAYSGYRFTGWSDGVTDETRTLTVTDDVTLTAQFERDDTGIEEQTLRQAISTAQGTLRIDNAEGQLVAVYDAAARLVATSRETSIELRLAAGIYLVTNGQQSAKVVIK